MGTSDAVSEVRARRHSPPNRADCSCRRTRGLESDAENTEQRALVRVRSQRLRGVPSPVRDDIHSDDRTRVQALAIGAGGASAQHRAGSYGDSDRFARDRTETVDPRLSTTGAEQLFGLAAAILALGSVYWLVRDQD